MTAPPRYDGLDDAEVAARVGVPRAVLLMETGSTMDDAHALAAAGAPAGTLVIADFQRDGRGRSGNKWVGVRGTSILCTLIERPGDAHAVHLLSIRAGLAVAAALDAFTPAPVQVKWPNDLLVEGGKVAGILIEARWRDDRLEWVALAIGINVGAPPDDVAGEMWRGRGLRSTSMPIPARIAVLEAVIPALRKAARGTGALSAAESAEWARRDALAGRRISAPAAGVVRGILHTGELVIDTPAGPAMARSGSVVLEER